MTGIRRPDFYDQIFDRLIEQILQEDTIPFDDWEDALDVLADEPDAEVILQEHGFTMQSALSQAATERNDFLTRARGFQLPLTDRFQLCQLLLEQAQGSSSPELLRLYCEIICDRGYLLDIDRSERTDEQDALSWLYGKEDSDALYTHLSARIQLSVRFKETLAKAKKLPPSKAYQESDMIHKQGKAIFQTYVKLFDFREEHTQFLNNIVNLLQIASASKELSMLKPLFLYKMLIRHGKRLRAGKDPQIDFCALWSYQTYQIDRDNGKSYKIYRRYLALFEALCDIFKADQQVDLPLCIYGFDHLSNLANFYRMYPQDLQKVPFDQPIQDFVDESLFTCFEHGYGDNVVLKDSGLSSTQLDRFLCSKDRNCVRALDRISKYMNEHIVELTEQFLEADSEQVKSLCCAILDASALSVAQQPKNLQDTTLFLASINGGLMEAVDSYALDYLTQAGNVLIGE